MKKIIAFLVCCFLIQTHSAQNYTPFPETTAVWDIYIQYSEPDPNIKEYKRYTMEGDTIINNLSYNKVYCSHYTLTYPPPPKINMTKLGYCFGIRQDIAKKKVYRTYTVNNTTIDTLLYDYDLKIGDVVPVTFTTSLTISPQTVEGIDSISFKGKKYRRFKLKTVGLHGAALIEGVGNANGLIEPHTGCFEACTSIEVFCDSEFHDCKKELALKIHEQNDPDYLQVFPNPFTEELTVLFKEASNSRELVIINVLGQEIQHLKPEEKQVSISRDHLKSGIYFLKVSDKTGQYIRKIIAK